MFKAVQYYDCGGKPLDKLIERDIYAADKASESFLIVDFSGQFTWIPMWTCRAYDDSDFDILKKQRQDAFRDYATTINYALLNNQRRAQLNSKG
jgi:hypothetical protein